jgi:hypothetical protein
VDFAEAKRLLGLDDDDEPTRDRVRRAYMRKLREHPPERDPEGFQRLRQAYELLDEPALVVALVTPPVAAPEVQPAPAPAPVVVVVAPTAPPPLPEPEPSPSEVIDEILGSLAEGNLDRAGSLAERCRRKLADDRQWAATLDQPRWIVVRELVYVCVVLPSDLVEAFVESIQTEDVGHVQRMLETYAHRDPDKTIDLQRYLSRRAPQLLRWATGFVAPGKSQVDPKRVAILLAIVAIIAVAVIALERCT